MHPASQIAGQLATVESTHVRGRIVSFVDGRPGTRAQLFGFEPPGASTFVGTGTLNWNYRVETSGGPLFVRKHRPERTSQQIASEHACLHRVVDRGVPAPLPHAAPGGATVLEHAGSLWSVFPWCDAAPPMRGEMTERQTWAAGEMHGRIHAILADDPPSGTPDPRLEYDTAGAFAELETLLGLARECKHSLLIETLELQYALLREHGPAARSYASLRLGMAPGDYHVQQLLFRGDRLVAVTDWELFGMWALVSELIRSLYFSRVLESAQMPAYLDGYRTHVQPSESDCRLGMARWWQGRLHTAWVFRAYLIEGNERVAEFFPETLRALRALADEESRNEITERFVRAAAL